MTESHAHSGDGKPDAKILIVGEAWGVEEERVRIPFSGTSGQELNRMLHEAGIQRSECYLTNLVNARPPHNDITKWVAQKRSEITMDMVRLREEYVKPIVREGYQRMLREITLVNPNIVIALGNSALWSLTGAKGILKWRGSQLNLEVPPTDWPADLITPSWVPPRPKLIPTIHPAAVLRDMSLRSIVIHDLKRAAREATSSLYSNVPDWKFVVRPTFDAVISCLQRLLALCDSSPEGFWLDFDLETRAGHIACAGLSWSRTEAISIPFMCVESREGYWLEEQEVEIVSLLHRLLTHRNVKVRGQNLLYDCQYTYRHWHFVPRVAQDTMISHHSAFAGLPKSLAYQASMYCDHYVYWKDDGKTWDKNVGEDQLWHYNCIDCVRTREVGEGSAETIRQLGLEKVDEFQQKMFWPVLQCMQRGVEVNKKLREKLAAELFEEMAAREELFQAYLGHPLNPKSPLQMSKLFYEDLKQQPVFTRAKNGVPGHLTCNDEALQTIAKREPLLRPLIKAIGEYRSLGVFLSTFVMAPLDIDGRMRTSYNICGTESFRFNSSENAFGSGTNLQNVPAGDESDEDFKLPNVRKIFVPDPGFTMFDKDLSKADLRIVTWEADEPEMKAMLKEGKDPYVEIAREFYKDPTIKKTRSDGSADPRYKTFKSFAHGTHYLGTPYGLAGRLGLSVPVAERTQRWYFERFPRIKAWQADFSRALASRRYVENIFGYRRYYFGRIDEATCREAIAWLPQSTVALYINRIWLNIYERYPQIWVLLQVHDSLVGQFPTHLKAQALRDLDEASQIVLPYDDPLIIPSGTKLSEVSWGDCE
ncbi:MAG: hypothetical protein E6Q97_36165 [Desulfurellales bacterium]|nr:MAG: hypothetical protein E6Q97_36165 [Desulfurellales bacterium]